jgi:hypothetical protein
MKPQLTKPQNRRCVEWVNTTKTKLPMRWIAVVAVQLLETPMSLSEHPFQKLLRDLSD